MMNAKNKYFKKLVYCVIITLTLGMIAMGIMWVVGPLSLSFTDSATPLFPKLAGLIALLAGVGFVGCLVFGLLWMIELFKPATDN